MEFYTMLDFQKMENLVNAQKIQKKLKRWFFLIILKLLMLFVVIIIVYQYQIMVTFMGKFFFIFLFNIINKLKDGEIILMKKV
jgi:hypothetical protein